MSALENMSKRLDFEGGKDQRSRMNLAKLKSLKKALLYSYQSQIAILEDNREFRCLINHDKLKEDYDDKVISIPYEDYCLNNKNNKIEKIGMKVGDVFTWKETNTKWIVIQEILEENAYFRGTIRKAEDEITINGKSYYGYLGKWSNGELWHNKNNIAWNEMGYEVVLYITRNEDTENFFYRFQKLKIGKKLWEVQMINDITYKTMLVIYLKETFINEFEDSNTETNIDNDSEGENDIPIIKINGKDSIYPYDTIEYSINFSEEDGKWEIISGKENIIVNFADNQKINLTVSTSKTGNFTLCYKRPNKNDIIKNIIIKSL